MIASSWSTSWCRVRVFDRVRYVCSAVSHQLSKDVARNTTNRLARWRIEAVMWVPGCLSGCLLRPDAREVADRDSWL